MTKIHDAWVALKQGNGLAIKCQDKTHMKKIEKALTDQKYADKKFANYWKSRGAVVKLKFVRAGLELQVNLDIVRPPVELF